MHIHKKEITQMLHTPANPRKKVDRNRLSCSFIQDIMPTPQIRVLIMIWVREGVTAQSKRAKQLAYSEMKI